MSAIVLAGGESQRMGVNKALLEFEGRPLIGWVLERVRELSDDVIIVAKDPAPYAHLGAHTVSDDRAEYGALIGLHTGLRAARHGLALAVGCDMPFLDLRLLRYMVVLSKAQDAVVPRLGGLPEPLHALYRVRPCLPVIKKALANGQLKMTSFLPHVTVRYVEEHELDLFDPQRLSFFNVNTADDWQTAQGLALQLAEGQGSRGGNS